MAMVDPEGGVHAEVEVAKADPIANLFTYHAPDEVQTKAYLEIRSHAMTLAKVIDGSCPESPDRTAAIRKLRECVMTANAAIATGGGFYR